MYTVDICTAGRILRKWELWGSMRRNRREGKEHDMSFTTATRELTSGQANTCHVILNYRKCDPYMRDASPLHRLAMAFTDMMIMLDMSPADLSAETGVAEQIIDRMEWWTESEQPGFLDVMKLAHYFDISLGQVEETMFDYVQRWSWK